MILSKYRLELVNKLSVFVNNNYTFYSVPGPVSTSSSLMSTTWAVISWSVPSYIPVDYPIITYEIGYTTHKSNGSCCRSDEFSPIEKTNTSSKNVNISDLIGNTCYLYGVRFYTDNLVFIILQFCFLLATLSNTSTITVLGILVGMLLIVVIVSVVGTILLLLYVRRHVKHIMFSVIKNFHFVDSNH